MPTRQCLLLLAAAYAPAAMAAVAWNEATAGDLANTGASPTVVTMALGSNEVRGTTGNPGTGIDRDYFTFAVPAGATLASLRVLAGTGVVGSLSFIGVQAGPVMTVSPTSFSAAGLLGWTHYSLADTGNDILQRVGVAANGSTGFSGALAAGSYTFWVQENGATTASYAFDFTLAPVPEPASALLMLAGCWLLAPAARRRCR